MNIVFGTIKKNTRDTSSHSKYPDMAVVFVEGVKGEGKSRRVLFNNKAMEVLNIPVGASQNIIFGYIEADEVGNRKILIANADMLANKEQTVVYNTSKNKVSFEDSKEKGKGISNSYLHREINQFLEVDEEINHEYELKFFGTNEGLDLYEFVKITSATDNESANDFARNPLEFDNDEDLQEAAEDNDITMPEEDEDVFDENHAETVASNYIPELD